MDLISGILKNIDVLSTPVIHFLERNNLLCRMKEIAEDGIWNETKWQDLVNPLEPVPVIEKVPISPGDMAVEAECGNEL